MYCSSRFLTFGAVSTETRVIISNTGKLGSTTDITMVVLVVELPVQSVILTKFRGIETVFEEQQL